MGQKIYGTKEATEAIDEAREKTMEDAEEVTAATADPDKARGASKLL